MKISILIRRDNKRSARVMSAKSAKLLLHHGHPRTRRCSKLSREVFTAWIRRVGSIEKNIPSENVPALLNDMHLYTSQTQVLEMLACAKEAPGKTSHLSYGEFYSFASQIKRSLDKGNNKQLARNVEQRKRRARKMSTRAGPQDVFLGGSCNPTTWRKEVAIPLFEKLGISYFNPQVSEWSSELVEIEHNAKENAVVLFYVLDKRTRNVAGIVEAANFAGCKRNLVLVMEPYCENEPVACESISHTEYQELCSTLLTLTDLFERCNVPVFRNIPDAVDWTAQLLNENSKTSQSILLKLRDELKLQKLKEIFDSFNVNGKGEISLTDFCSAYPHCQINGLKNSEKGPGGVTINFRQFCQIINKYNGVQQKNIESEPSFFYKIFYPFSYFLENCCIPRSQPDINNTTNDIYISGSRFEYDLKDNAIPLLKQSGLKYLVADGNLNQTGSKEINLIENSKAVIFVLGRKTRGLETMALAAYYIGTGKKIILCIQDLEENNLISEERLTDVARNDYNRGRAYLKDLAVRNGHPVFDSVYEAIHSAIESCSTDQATNV